MNPSLLNLVLLSVCILGCCGYIRIRETDQNAALAEKIATANATLYNFLEKPFLVKTVQAIASMDPTLRDFIATINKTPIQVFECIEKDVQRNLPASEKMSLSSYVEALIKTCPDYEAEIVAVQNVTENLDNYTPDFITELPPDVYRILAVTSNYTLLLLDDFNSIYDEEFQKEVVTNLVPLITNLSDADRISVADQVPWLAPFITPNGNYTASLQRTLDLVSSGIETSFNNSELASSLTNLTLGAASEIQPILEWLYAKIDALPVSNDIQADSEITEAADTLAQLAINYGKPMLGSPGMPRLLQVLLDGRFYFVDFDPKD